MKLSKKHVTAITLVLIVSVLSIPLMVLSQAPPAVNTIQHNVGIYFSTIQADDYWFRGVNLTAFFIALLDAIENFTLPGVVFEETVEWGLVYGTTGDWFNHTLPGEPVYIGLQMHPDNLTYDAVLVYPEVYDKSATQWQLGLYWFNGTQITDNTDMLVMYHMRYEVSLQDPNEPQLPAQEPT